MFQMGGTKNSEWSGTLRKPYKQNHAVGGPHKVSLRETSFENTVTRKTCFWVSDSKLSFVSDIQLNLFHATIHLGDMEIAIDRWLLIAE